MPDRLSAQEMINLLDTQLRNAQAIQRKIIPRADSFRSQHYSFYSYLKPFRRVGGDFFDFRILDDGCVNLILADATGHGIDAAMITGMVKLIYSYAMKDEKLQHSPSKVIEQVNNDIENLLDFSFFSCFSLLLDPNNDRVYWNNAGHPAALLLSENKKTVHLNSTLPLIGMHSMLTIPGYLDMFNDFSPGDKLILFTDGIVEGKNQKGEQYGYERILKVLEGCESKNLDTLCQVLINDFQEFTKNSEPSDDVCLLGLGYEE